MQILPVGHPAHPGRGLFAQQVYNEGDIIGPYVGRVYSHGIYIVLFPLIPITFKMTDTLAEDM